MKRRVDHAAETEYKRLRRAVNHQTGMICPELSAQTRMLSVAFSALLDLELGGC
jgi:hypothetical protein